MSRSIGLVLCVGVGLSLQGHVRELPPSPPDQPRPVIPEVVRKPIKPVPPPLPEPKAIGSAETSFKKGGKSPTRALNVYHAADKLDGLTVEPGATFSFNAIVGPRTKGNGFHPAPEIFLGEMVEGIGGGTCQVSSTLFLAALRSQLKVVERHAHSRPPGYMEKGTDATVSFPSEPCPKCQDLKLQNPYTSPIQITTKVIPEPAGPEGTETLIVTILGTEEIQEPTLKWRTYSTEPYSKRFRKTNEYLGKIKKRKQSGSPGTYGALYIGKDLRILSRYQPVDEVWIVGLGWDMSVNPWD